MGISYKTIVTIGLPGIYIGHTIAISYLLIFIQDPKVKNKEVAFICGSVENGMSISISAKKIYRLKKLLMSTII